MSGNTPNSYFGLFSIISGGNPVALSPSSFAAAGEIQFSVSYIVN